MRSASPRCGNATTTRWPERMSAASSLSASARPRAAIAGRCASNVNGCACGNGSSSVDAGEGRWIADAVFLPDPAHVVGLEDEIGRALERRHEIVGHLDDRLDVLVVGQRRLQEVGPAFGRRIERRLCDRVERALRERREGAHRLDLVAEELDPERLAAGRREDVDDAAAHGELAAVVHALGALVAREGERLRQALDAELEAGAHLDRLGTGLGRRQPLGERPR